MNRELLQEAMAGRRAWTDRRRQSAFTTALLLLDDESPLRGAALRAIAKGAITIDSRLVEDLYRSSGDNVRVAIAQDLVAALLPPAKFRRIFFESLARRRDHFLRDRLLQALRFHVAWHRESARLYRPLISRLLRRTEGEARLHALELVSRLDRVAAADLAIVVEQLGSRRESERINAVHALATWASRPTVSRAVRLFSRSEYVEAAVRKMRRGDPSADVRSASAQYLRILGQSEEGRSRRSRHDRRASTR